MKYLLTIALALTVQFAFAQDMAIEKSSNQNKELFANENCSIINTKGSNEISITFYNELTSPANASIYDLSGKLVLSQNLDAGANSVKFNTSGLSKGQYLLNVSSKDKNWRVNKKVMIQ